MFALEYHEEITRQDLREEGHDEFAELLRKLKAEGRSEDFERALADKAFRESLFAELS